MISQKNIIITGAEGFIGSNLMRHIKNIKKYSILFAIDKAYYGNEFDKEFLSFKMDLGDKKNDEFLDEYISICDIVIHCAGIVGVDNVTSGSYDPYEIFEVDRKIIDLCKKHNKKLVYFSSSEIYGSSESPLNEESEIKLQQKERSSYALEKLFAEKYIQNNLGDYLIIRPFNVAGPFQSSERGVVSKFIKNCLLKKPLEIRIFNEKSTRRSYIHIDDFCEILIKLLEANVTMEVYNIGAPQNNFSAEELANLISDTLHMPIREEYKEIQADSRTDYEIDQRIPDIKKVLKDLNLEKFEFKNMTDIILDTAKYFEENRFKML